MGNSTIRLLTYTDDLALLGNNIETVKLHYRKLINIASKCGLKINDKKTKYVIIGRRNRQYRQGEFIYVEHNTLRKASYFKYLESIITQDESEQ